MAGRFTPPTGRPADSAATRQPRSPGREVTPSKVTALDEPDRRSILIRCALDALALTLDGQPAAATTIARKRAVFYGVLNYAVELDILPANPIGKVTWKAPEVAEEIDRRVVARPKQVRELLSAV